MRTHRRTVLATILCFVSVAVTLPLVAHAARSIYRCTPCPDLANSFIRADLSPTGSWVLGTQNGGWQPEAQRLLYGFVPDGRSLPGSGFTTLRVAGPRGLVALSADQVISQTRVDDRIDTVWESSSPYRVRVTESVGLVDNPLSGQPDAVVFGVDARNDEGVALEIGVRTLLDVRVGRNDGAPYLVPGVGGVTTESEYFGAQVPPAGLSSWPVPPRLSPVSPSCRPSSSATSESRPSPAAMPR